MTRSSLRINPGPSAEALGIVASIGGRIASHLGSVIVGLYQGATGATDSPSDAIYTIPLAVGVVSGASANILVQALVRSPSIRPLRQDYDLPRDGVKGAVKGGLISVAELGAGYLVGYTIGSLVDKLS